MKRVCPHSLQGYRKPAATARAMQRRGLAVVCATLAVVALTGCSEGERSIEYDGFVLTEEPAEAPRVFPPGFVYPGARSVMSGVYTRSPYASTREGVLVYESEDPLPQIQAFYLRKFEALGWQIIQSQEKSGVVFLLAENLSRRLFTVILRGGMPASPASREAVAEANDEPDVAGTDKPLAPLARTAEGDESPNATESGVVQIKLYIKQAGLR
ncbi:MAG: hypothetical protein RIF32_05530 [Leptospirales bacterium]|jgi:hypothetical protein